MAGRRLRRAVRDILIANGIVEPIITIAGLANSYTHYIATFEEYQGQRYEAASTIFGPHTLEAYIQEFKRLTHDFLNGQPSTSEIAPRDLSKNQISIQPPVIVDTVGPFRKFGSMAIDAKESYTRGDNVFVSFRSANPRNNQRIEGTFLTVEKQDESGKWQTLYVDGDWCTKFYWKGGVGHFGESFAEITWDIPSESPKGLYRICHQGTRKTIIGDATTSYFSAPDWLLSNIMGSKAIHLAWEAYKLGFRFSEKIRYLTGTMVGARYKDFSGCSRSFLVK